MNDKRRAYRTFAVLLCTLMLLSWGLQAGALAAYTAYVCRFRDSAGVSVAMVYTDMTEVLPAIQAASVAEYLPDPTTGHLTLVRVSGCNAYDNGQNDCTTAGINSGRRLAQTSPPPPPPPTPPPVDTATPPTRCAQATRYGAQPFFGETICIAPFIISASCARHDKLYGMVESILFYFWLLS